MVESEGRGRIRSHWQLSGALSVAHQWNMLDRKLGSGEGEKSDGLIIVIQVL